MARILYASQISELKGSIGGLSFQRNSSGTTCRLKPSRIQSAKTKQMPKQINFASAANAWHLLSQTDVENWNEYAAAHQKYNSWGELKTLSGYNWFMALYNNALLVGATPRTTCPAAYSPLAMQESDLVYTSSVLDFESSEFVHESHYLVAYCSPPIFSYGQKDRSRMRFMKVFPPGTDSVWDFKDEWLAAFGFASLPAPATNQFAIMGAMLTIHESDFIASPYWIFTTDTYIV
jgi:hypothetical protein